MWRNRCQLNGYSQEIRSIPGWRSVISISGYKIWISQPWWSTPSTWYTTFHNTIFFTKPRYVDHTIREATLLDLQTNNMKREDGFCLSKSWKPLTGSLKDCWKQLLQLGPPPGHIGPGTLTLSGHWLCPLQASINPEPFFPFLASCLLLLIVLIPCCMPTTHMNDVSTILLISLPTTHTYDFYSTPSLSRLSR